MFQAETLENFRSSFKKFKLFGKKFIILINFNKHNFCALISLNNIKSVITRFYYRYYVRTLSNFSNESLLTKMNF